MVGAPSGTAAFNVQGSTLHHLLGIGVTRPEDNITQKVQEKLQSQLKNVLCLIIDKRSMLSSIVLGAAERNIRTTVYSGQNSQDDLEQWINHHVSRGHGPPTFFITLSCAENWWPDLRRLLYQLEKLAGNNEKAEAIKNGGRMEMSNSA
jgi:hypothetical protein